MSAIDARLADARHGLTRVDPFQAASAVRQGGLLVDIRPAAQRERYGEIPDAVIVERNVLEWRLDPSSPDRHPAVTDDVERAVVVVCQEGYASSLAAESLRALGLLGATDLDGGFAAWEAAGLPVSQPGGA
ncbi:MAG TPA: rhodanese-like domain-containing protein [Acidimicrobiales bacterium]|nr:rhodanese-like domain-containing protein [Acidimicrobiales bacterium]